ncbi:MAG: ATP-dependent DNA helicase RecG [Verrucomicrobiales bacterium]
MPDITPETPVTELEFVKQRTLSSLEKLNYTTVGDLLLHFPRRYEDRREFDRFPSGPGEQALCLHGEVTDAKLRFGGRKRFFEATIEQADAGALSSPVVCRWFNMPYVSKVIATGQRLVVYGKVKQSGQRLVIDHPEFEVVDPDSDETSIHLGRITPVYGLREGIGQRPLRTLLFRCLESLDDASVAEFFDPADAGFPRWTRSRALREIHFPSDDTTLENARRFLAFEEFFALQLNVAVRRQHQQSLPGARHCGTGKLLKQFAQSLPFPLTGAQRRSIQEIRADLKLDRPMARLLQGDVGSGKTFVAMGAILLAIESGCQAALMAPTQILAEQHFLTFKKWLDPLGVRLSLRTSARKEDNAGLPLFDGGGGDSAPQVIIGTHALLFGDDTFEDLGLVVVDEQHKFGVAQRAKLISHGTTPDVLVMTATPIPRTLTMTVYGDLDVSVLDELPAGRGKIVTAVRDLKTTPKAAKFVREQLEAGRQAYIVYPLIDESDKLSAKAATAEFEAWAERLDPFPCDLLHGKVSAEEKDAIMGDFRDGKTKALVATTVIEVGVDVPNANIMLIYNAERFGLAQLHQLRGRIGRGAHKSYCILMCDTKKDAGAEKLAVLEETTDGFRIAEADLKLRGPGELLGTAQSGLAGLRLGDLITQTDLVRSARELAERTLASDPTLTDPGNANARRLLHSLADLNHAP